MFGSRLKGAISRTSSGTRFGMAAICACVSVGMLAAGGCILDGDEEENHSPVIELVSANPSSVLPDSVAMVSVLATDKDGDGLQYQWTADAGSFPEGAGTRTVSWKAPDSSGVCSLAVVVSDGAAAARGSVKIQVLEPHSALSFEPDTLDFSTDLANLNVEIKNLGTGILAWTVYGDRTWLSCFPASGWTSTETDVVEVSVDRSYLGPGHYTGHLCIDSSAGADTVTVIVEDPNLPPESFVSVAPPGGGVNGLFRVQVFIYGLDPDGEVVAFFTRMEPALIDTLGNGTLDTLWTGDPGYYNPTPDTAVCFHDWRQTVRTDTTYQLVGDVYYRFSVKAVDDLGLEDPTPATWESWVPWK